MRQIVLFLTIKKISSNNLINNCIILNTLCKLTLLCSLLISFKHFIHFKCSHTFKKMISKIKSTLNNIFV